MQVRLSEIDGSDIVMERHCTVDDRRLFSAFYGSFVLWDSIDKLKESPGSLSMSLQVASLH